MSREATHVPDRYDPDDGIIIRRSHARDADIVLDVPSTIVYLSAEGAREAARALTVLAERIDPTVKAAE